MHELEYKSTSPRVISKREGLTNMYDPQSIEQWIHLQVTMVQIEFEISLLDFPLSHLPFQND